ncbi:uncharacterized protein LOC133871591 [Alnus glutinosa]|uniref:uncharacterized protein LOC133871591 n=1 Tax=Alnus glutinosa TaxID=3517 RepID=UPI002D774362|nr:uncharacterized protein LOC133871591 [Alnus glutinosa]
MAEEQKPVLLMDHYVPTTYTPSSSLQLPNITAAHYEIKPSIIQMLQSFYGLNNEDPYKYLDDFLEICLTMRLQNISEDALRNSGPSVGVQNQAHPLPPNQSYNPNYRPHQYHYQLAPPPRNSAFEEKVLTAIGNLEANTQLLNSHSQSIAKLEGQVGQLECFQRTTHKQVQAVTTLRSGRTVDNQVRQKNTEEDESRPNPKLPLENPKEKLKTTPETPYEPRASFPERLKEPPSAIPSYAKFLKDLCTQKRKMRKRSPEKILLTEQVSSLIQDTVAPKIKDPSAPTISCIIGDHTIDKALLDLGAGVNLLPYSVYEQLGLGELKPMTVVLQLADKSVKKPRGIIEDVIIRVDRFYFLVDFIVLDTEPIPDPARLIPVILGHPFLATANACINCKTGEMEITFGNMKVRLNIFKAFQHPPDINECFLLDMIEETVKDTLPNLLIKDPLEACLSHFDFEDFDTEHYVGEVNSLLDTTAAIDFPPWRVPKELLPSTSGIPHIPSLISPPKL